LPIFTATALPIRTLEAIRIEEENYRKERTEPYTCYHFGCGKKLSLIESMAGKYCTVHSGVGKVDIMKVIKFR